MNITLLFALLTLASLGSKVSQKFCSNLVLNGKPTRYFLYLTVNSIVACCFFFVSGGFSLHLNWPTFAFSLVYAAVVGVILIATIPTYDVADISDVNVLLTFVSLLCTALMGRFLFGERLDATAVWRIVILFLATLLVFFAQKRRKEPNKRKWSSFKLAFLIAVIILSNSANTVVTKAFALSDSVSDENTFFFFTNFILALGAGLVFALRCRGKKEELSDSLAMLTPRRLFAIGAGTLCSNVGSLVSIWILAQMDLVISSPITSGLGIVVGVLASLLFRERLHFFSYLAAAVAFVAVIL